MLCIKRLLEDCLEISEFLKFKILEGQEIMILS